MIKITIFTPTYNRAYTLDKLYNSLMSQTNKEFIWLIIDDGSTDNTKDLVDSWIKENKIEIKYIYQDNQGMHGAHNTAYHNISTEYNTCVDSDDYMPANAVEIILINLESIHGNPSYAGLVGLDSYVNGEIVGTVIPNHLNKVKLNELYLLHGVTGDKKIVYKTSLVNEYPEYPIFKGEKFVPLDYKYLLIDQDYYLKPVNEVFCIVEYLPDGSSRNMFRQYMKNPKGFAFSRLTRIKYAKTFKEKLKNSIHLNSSALFIGDLRWVFRSSDKMLAIFTFPLGILLNLYIRIKAKN